MSAHVAIIVITVLATALFVASRVQKRKDVQVTPTICDHTDLRQREPLNEKLGKSATLNSPFIVISGHEEHSAPGPDSSQPCVDDTKPTDSSPTSQLETPSSSSQTKTGLTLECLKDRSSRERQRTINRARKQTDKSWRNSNPARRARTEQLYAEAFGRQMKESRLLFGRCSVSQPRPYLLLLPTELKAMILRNLTLFKDLKNLTQAIATYHVIAHGDNIFTEATLSELESRDISLLPRDVALPERCFVENVTISVRILGRGSKNCKQFELLQAVASYVRNRIKNGGRFQFTFKQCLAILSVLDVEKWSFSLISKSGPLAKDVDNPRE